MHTWYICTSRAILVLGSFCLLQLIMHEFSDWDWWIIVISAAPNEVNNSAPEGRKSFPQCLNIAIVVIAQIKYNNIPVLLLNCKFSRVINLTYECLHSLVEFRGELIEYYGAKDRDRDMERKWAEDGRSCLVSRLPPSLSLSISSSFSVAFWPSPNRRSYI